MQNQNQSKPNNFDYTAEYEQECIILCDMTNEEQIEYFKKKKGN